MSETSGTPAVEATDITTIDVTDSPDTFPDHAGGGAPYVRVNPDEFPSFDEVDSTTVDSSAGAPDTTTGGAA